MREVCPAEDLPALGLVFEVDQVEAGAVVGEEELVVAHPGAVELEKRKIKSRFKLRVRESKLVRTFDIRGGRNINQNLNPPAKVYNETTKEEGGGRRQLVCGSFRRVA